MDIARQLKQGINTGNIVFGQRQTSSECSKGGAKMVLVAANCPESFIDELRNSHPSVPVHQVTLVNRQLGAACGKPFPVSSLCIIDAGQSDLLQLAPNFDWIIVLRNDFLGFSSKSHPSPYIYGRGVAGSSQNKIC